MGTYQLFANLTTEEYDRLRDDIALHGVRDPIELDEEGNILDGHHRKTIADDLGITYPTIVRTGWTEEQKRDHIVAIHLGRRNLSPEDRKQFIRQLKATNPEMTTRGIAARVGVDHSTVIRDLKSGAGAPVVAPPVDDRPQRALDMKAANPEMTTREIGLAIGAHQTSVSNWLRRPAEEARKAADPAPKWDDLEGAMTSIEALSRADAALIAAAVPPRRRQKTAKRLRAEGIVLGQIAVCLEQMERLGTP